ncbi:SNF2-related protein [Actinophytocola sp.]|uniref:SNF2-related protein n=1 Tax=Actinophytocola sp. TaxID=1872138 RepID=UPI0039C87A32
MLVRDPDLPGQGEPPALPDQLLSLLARLRAAPVVDPAASALVDRAVAVLRRPGFDTLLSLPQLGFEPFDYQRETAATVLRRMRGRAILADEVGLGKTIEAGLITAELRLRGLADRTLVITPAGLVEQWRDELERKFGLPTAILAGKDRVPDRRGSGPVLLASLAAARRDPLRTELTGTGWDLVIADEAHRTARGTQRVRQADPCADRPVPAAADRDAGGEPAAGPLRDDLAGGARPAGHPGPVPHPARTIRP